MQTGSAISFLEPDSNPHKATDCRFESAEHNKGSQKKFWGTIRRWKVFDFAKMVGKLIQNY